MIRAKHIDEFCQETRAWDKSYKGANAKMPVLDLDDRLRKIEKRLLIVMPDENIQTKYPALKKAYEEYMIIEN